MSRTEYPVLPVLFSLFLSACPVLPILFCLSWHSSPSCKHIDARARKETGSTKVLARKTRRAKVL
jgi:hypothetical protein